VIKGLRRARETETSKEMEAVQDLSEAVSGRVVCDLIKYYRRYEKWKNCEWRRFIIYIFSSLLPTAKPNAKELGKEIKMLQNGKNRRNKHKERNRNTYCKDVTSKESTVLLSLLPTVL